MLCLLNSTIILLDTQYVYPRTSKKMNRWNHTTKKTEQEITEDFDGSITAVDIDSEVYEGEVQLAITPFESFSQINKFKKYLSSINDLKIISENWSEEEGLSIAISLQEPLALAHVLRDMPEVARVKLSSNKSCHNDKKHGSKKMVVVMKTPEAALEPVPA